MLSSINKFVTELGAGCMGDDGTKAPIGKVLVAPYLPMVLPGAQITGICNKVMFNKEWLHP